MACYTLRYLGRRDGGFRGLTEVEADDPGQAVRIAAQRVGRRPAELWCGGTLIHRFEGVRIGRPSIPLA